jgi:hypothetical protein
MEAFVILLIVVGVIAFTVCVAKSLDLKDFAPDARPLDEQGPIHSRGYSPFALRVPGSQRDVFSDLVKRARALKEQHPNWYLPDQITERDWQQSLIFVRVVYTLVDALSVEPESIRRGSRLVQDLGA